MIITCPNCAACYQVAAETIHAGGRAVRCARCRHVWHHSVETAPTKPASSQPSQIIQCPQCCTSFKVPTARIPAEGRTVRCTRCLHTWHHSGQAQQGKPFTTRTEYSGSGEVPARQHLIERRQPLSSTGFFGHSGFQDPAQQQGSPTVEERAPLFTPAAKPPLTVARPTGFTPAGWREGENKLA